MARRRVNVYFAIICKNFRKFTDDDDDNKKNDFMHFVYFVKNLHSSQEGPPKKLIQLHICIISALKQISII